MKLSINWLKELVDLKMPIEELIRLLPLRTIGLKDITKDYIELDMKGYNRADLLSLRGVALEVAAITDSKIKFAEPNTDEYIWVGQNLPNADLRKVMKVASVYCLAEITGLKVKESPEEWKKKLIESGIRPVNNLADITNLVMIEYGQPMHAFDAQKSQGIHVDQCYFDQKFTTLDGKERLLQEGDILIWGNSQVIGLGGIIGGKDSEVTDQTTSIHLEAAIFNPIQIRKTATRLGLQSEASKRFYHGLTTKRLFQALDAAIRMYQSLGGTLKSISIIDHKEKPLPTITLSQDKINSLIGVEISPTQVEQYLNKLQFNLQKEGNNWQVNPPYYRLDIEIEEDLIEEVARLYGYEKIPAKPLNTNMPTLSPNPIFDLISRLKQALFTLGLTEVQTYSYYSARTIVNYPLSIVNLIKVANPISSETEYLKSNLWPNLVEVVARNIKQGYKDISLFEIGKVYYPQEGKAEEEYHLSIAVSNQTNNPIHKLYQIARNLGLPLAGVKLNPRECFHPTRYTDSLAEVHKRITDKFGISQRVAVLEIGLTKLL